MRRILGVFWLLVVPTLALAQAPPAPPPACEVQVQDAARQLTTDGLLPQAVAPQWGPQLLAITSQLRMVRSQYEIKKGQAELAEQQLAQLLERLRQAQVQLQALRDETEAAKASMPPPAN